MKPRKISGNFGQCHEIDFGNSEIVLWNCFPKIRCKYFRRLSLRFQHPQHFWNGFVDKQIEWDTLNYVINVPGALSSIIQLWQIRNFHCSQIMRNFEWKQLLGSQKYILTDRSYGWFTKNDSYCWFRLLLYKLKWLEIIAGKIGISAENSFGEVTISVHKKHKKFL